ncbi:hypothetical protein ABFT80_01730 [Mesorhizobium sp. SB112]|uniref:hypothetical protein n=1 Tax=Mesorhizobium sp. SB112 TaxID=3151853 RepID=UPI003266A075
MNTRHKGSSFWVALVAAYVLVLQSTFGALALGTAPGAMTLDVFGNPLCITSSDQQGSDIDHVMPNCCVLGCSMFAPVSSAPPETASLRHEWTGSFAILLPLAASVIARSPEHDPGSPRAPPLAV